MVLRKCCARVMENRTEMNSTCVTALDLKECLKQIKVPISLHTCAPFSE